MWELARWRLCAQREIVDGEAEAEGVDEETIIGNIEDGRPFVVCQPDGDVGAISRPSAEQSAIFRCRRGDLRSALP